MSKTRNQRRRARIIERVLTIIMFIAFAVLVVMLARQIRDLSEMEARMRATHVEVVRAEDFLPSGFSAESAAYKSATKRYEIEQGHIIPGQKGAAPESANSEADRCKGAS